MKKSTPGEKVPLGDMGKEAEHLHTIKMMIEDINRTMETYNEKKEPIIEV